MVVLLRVLHTGVRSATLAGLARFSLTLLKWILGLIHIALILHLGIHFILLVFLNDINLMN